MNKDELIEFQMQRIVALEKKVQELELEISKLTINVTYEIV